MTACAAASGVLKRSCAIAGAIVSAVKTIQNLVVIELSPPSAAESAHGAPGSHAGEAVVALHARDSTIVISAKNAVMLVITAPLEALTSQARYACTAVKGRLAPGPCSASGVPAGHFTVRIGHSKSVRRIVRPRPAAEFPVEFAEAISVKERVIDEDAAAEPIRPPTPSAPPPPPPTPPKKTQNQALPGNQTLLPT